MEIAAAALQFTTVAIQAFRGCILAIEFVSTAQHMGADGDLFRTGLEFEKYRLMTWAQRVGLLGDEERQTLNWQLAGMILGQLESFLTSANVLKSRYALEVTEEEVQAADDTSRDADQPRKSGVSRLIARLKPNLRTAAGQIIQEHNSPVKRLRWAARDKAKLQAFLGEISALIDKLEFLLDSSERQQEKAEYDRLLREVISLATTTAEAGQIKDFLAEGRHHQKGEQSINAAAYLKQVRLTLGADKREDEISPKLASEMRGLKMPKLPVLKRSLKPWNGGELFESNLEFATYGDKQVLIQWKLVEGTQWERYTPQIKCLTVFLMSLSDQSFRSLPCMGYYPLQSHGRHGIVYSMPTPNFSDTPEPDSDSIPDWDLRTLHSLLHTHPHLSLSRRLSLAHALATTLLQLHTAGWLHKNLSSSNLIFLAPRGSSSAYFLQTNPYVIGYEYARSDTRDAAKAFTHLPDTELEADLYRHPKARGEGRETYQKRFDLYALACIIVEFVMWRPLVEIFEEYMTEGLREAIRDAQARNEVVELPALGELFGKEEAVRAFRHQAGEAVLEVVRMCYSVERAKEDEEALLGVQTAVVEKLAWCRV